MGAYLLYIIERLIAEKANLAEKAVNFTAMIETHAQFSD